MLATAGLRSIPPCRVFKNPTRCLLYACRSRVRERSLRYGLLQHQMLGKDFEGSSIFAAEGKCAMADAYRAWRMKGFVLTRWQMLALRREPKLELS